MTNATHTIRTRRGTLTRVAAVALAGGIAASALTARGQDPMAAPPTVPPTTGPTTGPAAPMVDNPQYLMWAKFKPGSSCTLTADVASPMGKVHREVTQTLKAVTADTVTLEVVDTMTMVGQTRTQPPQTATVKSKEDHEDAKQVGTEDVPAMGKTLKCRVFEQSTKDGQPLPGGRTAKYYVCDEVPGGIVKAELPGPAGAAVTLELKSTEVK